MPERNRSVAAGGGIEGCELDTRSHEATRLYDWSIERWLIGVFGLLVATFYVVCWYLVFSLPLLAVFGVIAAAVFAMTANGEQSILFALIGISPVAMVFLVWQVISFVGPAYIGLVQSVGLFLQRAHLHEPRDLLRPIRVLRRRTCRVYSGKWGLNRGN